MQELFKLFVAFFRIGLFTFGGGYSMLPMLERELTERRDWITSEELLDYFAISQCTPGVIAVNTATLVGYTRCGFLGSVFATVGVITPSFVIIIIIAAILNNFAHIPAVVHAFAGIRVAVAALIVSAIIKLLKSNVLKKPQEEKSTLLPICLCISAFLLSVILNIFPGYLVAGATIIGLLFYRKV